MTAFGTTNCTPTQSVERQGQVTEQLGHMASLIEQLHGSIGQLAKRLERICDHAPAEKGSPGENKVLATTVPLVEDLCKKNERLGIAIAMVDEITRRVEL